MKWSNVAWLLSIASLAFGSHLKLAKGLDGVGPKKTVDIIVQSKHTPKGPRLVDHFMLSKIPVSHYQNTTSTSLSPQGYKRGSTSASGTDTLWANALWGSTTIAGFNASWDGDVRIAESFNLPVQGDK